MRLSFAVVGNDHYLSVVNKLSSPIVTNPDSEFVRANNWHVRDNLNFNPERALNSAIGD